MRGKPSIEGWRDRLLVTIDEAALLLNISVREVYRLVADGLIQKVKVKKCAGVTTASLQGYYERITTSGGGE